VAPLHVPSSAIAGRYEVVRALGAGAFGRTLLANDLETQRPVALKVLRAESVPDWKAYELFDREGAVLRALRHPGVPAIYDTFRATWEGRDAAFLAMEYVEGTSLDQIIQEQHHLDPQAVQELFVELLGVLDYLHTRTPPVLHRDIKPANVIVRGGNAPVLVDFGAVRNVFRAPNESSSTVVGTYGYMPYEQYMGQASPSSDLYALAATWLHLITGRPPADFMSDDARIVVPGDLPPGDPMRRVLARMLASAPGDLFASAREARAALFAAPAAAIVPAVQPRTASAVTLAAPPRAIEGDHAVLLQRLSRNMWQLMDPEEKHGGGWSVADVCLVTFFSVITAGILPAVFWSISRSRTRRYRTFITYGLPAEARVLEKLPKDVGFGAKLTKVRYEFEADGRLHRDSDLVMPRIADRWDPGSVVQVLYMPDADYESVIISTS
jgi:serine/threonine protein kinase